jgi:hypothetical protein
MARISRSIRLYRWGVSPAAYEISDFLAGSDRVDRDAQGVSISRQLAAISLSVHIWITGGQQDRYIARGRGVCGSAGANGALPRRGKPHRLNRSAKLW